MIKLTRRQAIVAGLSALVAAAVPWPAEAKPAKPAPPCDVTTDGWCSTDLHVGDVFTIEGRYAINPITHKPTEMLQCFIVTAVAADSASVEVYPGRERVSVTRTKSVKRPPPSALGQRRTRASHRAKPLPSRFTRPIRKVARSGR